MPADRLPRRTHDSPLTSPCIRAPVSALSITALSICLAVEGESLRELPWPCSLLFYRFCFFSCISSIVIINWFLFGRDWHYGCDLEGNCKIGRIFFSHFIFVSVCLGFHGCLLNFDFAGPVAEEHSSNLFCSLLCFLDVHSKFLTKIVVIPALFLFNFMYRKEKCPLEPNQEREKKVK